MTLSATSEQQQGAISIAPSRYALCIEYAGAAYKGWQIQKSAEIATVQGELERALSRIANESVHVICAGRTDTGVNATYQIVHFDTVAQRDTRAWVMGSNANLPADVAVRWAMPVADDFHARFSALERRYRYLIYSSEVMPAILSKGVTWTYKSLDIARMQQAGQYLLGEHDFSSYRAVGCQAKSPVREIRDLRVYQAGALIVLDISANAFLHHMVRNIAGVLMKIGAGEAEPDWARQVLQAKDRRAGGVTAPPFGLYFVDVKYPSRFDLPPSALGPYFLTISG